MELREKLVHLRLVEGQLRGFGRPLTKAEVVRLMQEEVGQTVSHSYLSQLESGARIHLSATSRDLIARFFKVHPGYLVSDPPGYQEAAPLSSPAPRSIELGPWLNARAEEVLDDPLLYRALLRLARQPDPRRYLLLLDDLLDLPPERLETLANGALLGNWV